MNRYSLILLFVLLFSWSSILNAQNILNNPGFEAGSESWVAGSWGGPTAQFSVDTETVKEGQQAMKVVVETTDTEAGKVFLRQEGVMLDPTKQYTASFQIWSNSGATESINLQLYSHQNIGATSWGVAFVENDITFEGDGTWHKFTYEFSPSAVAGAPDLDNLGFMFGFARNATTFYVDNVVLSTDPDPEPDQPKTYHVSKSGDDNNPGTSTAPFLTISKAADILRAGDTCIIHEGAYEETVRPSESGQAGFPIVFQAAEGEQVIVTAMQALNDWTLDEGAIYKTTVDWDLGQKNFVMNGSTVCDLARWPNNTDGDPFTLNSVRNTGGSHGDVIFDAFLTDNKIPDLDWSNGGSVLFYGDRPGSGWTTWKAFIKTSTSGRITFDLDKSASWIRTAHPPADGGDYFLEGIKEAIDYQNEWYFDEETKTLYLQLPNGRAPVDGEVSMRRRNMTFDLNGRSYIEINNLAVFGGGIEISGSENKLYGVSSFYGNYTRGVVRGFNSNSQSVHIKNGSGNIIEQCEIAFGAGTGIWDSGNGTQILNCKLHDFNFIGDYDAVIMARGGSNTVIKHNEIFRAGRDCLQNVNKGSEVSYNDFYRSNLIADDCALFYTLGPGLNMKIHHNWFHDTESRGSLKKAAGVYLDNDAADVEVNHNVIWNTEWSNIQINWNGINIDVFNNTLWDGSAAMGAWHKDGTEFSDVRVWNNLTNMNSLEPQSDKQNNLIITDGSNPFNDSENDDFTLKPGAMAIDFGRIIPGFTDGYVGTAPDAGAYESGVEPWLPGINWDEDLGPAGVGCYGLPGEQCGGIVSIPENRFQFKTQVYPNPVSGDQLNVVLEGHDGEVVAWDIFSMNGQLIKYGQQDNTFGLMELDISNLSKGAYVLRLRTATKSYTAQIIRLKQ